MKEIEINQTEKIKGYGSIEKTVKPQGNGAMILVPKSWTGKRVKVILIEPL
jgi:putative transposon-encoded protein